MNKISLLGRLTSNPELKNTQSGKSVCEFNIAVNRDYVKEDGTRDADFIRCEVWNKMAENLCKYQSKGNRLLINGSLRNRDFEDKNGNKRYITYVEVNEMEFIESKPKKIEENKTNDDQVYEDFGNEITLTDEDLGF